MDDLSDMGTIMHACNKKSKGESGNILESSETWLAEVRDRTRYLEAYWISWAERLKKNNQSCSAYCKLDSGTSHPPPGDHFPKIAAAENITECYYY